MTLPFKPMLSASLDGVDLSTLHYPLLVSPKLDGVRCIVWEGVAYSRNAKPIRNRFVQTWAKNLHNLDGELIVGSTTEGEVLGRTQSGVMSFDGQPNFTYWMFDTPDRLYRDVFDASFEFACGEVEGGGRIIHVEQTPVENQVQLEIYENEVLERGYEGVMLRSAIGPYKHGRSTLREGYLMKLKRFQDGEAEVIGIEQGSSNQNDLDTDELGRAKRSKRADGLVPSGMVGTIIVRDATWGELRVAPGTMSHAERRIVWETPNLLLGKTIHWRSFGYGVKDKPRFPRYYGIREDV